MAPAAGARAQGSFDILEDASLGSPRLHAPATADARDVLEELSVDYRQNQAVAAGSNPVAIVTEKAPRLSAVSPEAKANKTKIAWRAARSRRPLIESETFEPLDAVLEESSLLVKTEETVPTDSPQAAVDELPQETEPEDVQLQGYHPLTALDADCNVQEQIEKHLAATPLKADAYTLSDMDGSQDGVAMTYSQPPPYPGEPLKVPEVVARVEQALSPSLSVVSERSESFVEGSSGAGSFSVPRIEDSLEELDKLEEELEAVNAATLSGPVAPVDGKPTKAAPKTPAEQKKVATMKRASMAGQSATVRIKPSEKARPTIRRSVSMTLRDKKQDGPDSAVEQKAAGTLSRHKSTTIRPTPATKSPAKSTKPPTVPKFELPGEAVALRLKEQRDARQALQAEAQKAQATPPRPRINRPLAKPTFELPGEAISRRKREEREVKLRAEEEEEKRRREFKARPVRHSIGLAPLPRETVASRARQNRTSQDEVEEKRAEASKTKRMSVGPTRATASTAIGNTQSPQARGRHSTVIPETDVSRATSSSTGTSGKRSTLSAEQIEQQRLRGREIFARDSVYAKDKERDRRDRESAAKQAREQAAERSRVASREWAEKKRRKVLATKQTKPAAEA
ncbi:hypothetical protein TOPH_00855 [Tolypocladium ophioglossoides CBS 100239]|uniref:Carboxylesterase family protein n=1 Tax=Tolypocladium ophioglossoides (strain CBS 100239) TaxID=1163406 RepID=A0A0L0NK78_TOLOC|nr:hypothetical protein TOPH_00855 [Tolypocladium ophioglossoides CBS 100239]